MLLGRGPEEDRLRRLAREIGAADRVRFVPAVDDEGLIELYRGARLVVVAPQGEDLGYVPLEAFLSKKAVLTTDDSGGPLEFVVNGQTGFVVAPSARSSRRGARSGLGAAGGAGDAGPGGLCARFLADVGPGHRVVDVRRWARPSMTPPDEAGTLLARESGRLLGELGVRPEDGKWIRAHARTIASLFGPVPRGLGRSLRDHVVRWARRAARAAR